MMKNPETVQNVNLYVREAQVDKVRKMIIDGECAKTITVQCCTIFSNGALLGLVLGMM